MFNERQRGALGNLRVMVQPGARGFDRNAGAQAGLGFLPVPQVVAFHAAMLNEEVSSVVANFVFGRLRSGGGILV